MISEADIPQEYIAQLKDDWRRQSLLDIRDILLSQTPQLQEKIHYKMLGYSVEGDFLFHLNAQQAYVSLYVGNASKIDPNGELLADLDVGKGCIRFKKKDRVSRTRVGEFIARTVELWEQGEDLGC